MSICDDLHAQEGAIAADVETTEVDLKGAIAELKQDPHNKFLAKEVAELEQELAELQSQLATVEQQIATQCSTSVGTTLVGARITFTTHDDDLETDSYINVFVRNQPADARLVLPQRDLIGNRLDWERHQETALTDRNPFLASGGPFGLGESWDAGSTHGPFELDLPLTPILGDDIGIPVVDVHLLTDGSDRWMFSWTLDLEFSNGAVLTSTSDTDAVAGIVLDENNRDHMGLGSEDTAVPRPPRQVPDTDAVLTEVTVAFHTKDDSKEPATGVRVHVVDRRAPDVHRSIAAALGQFAGEGLDTGSVRFVVFGPGGLPLDGDPLALRDLVLPLVFVGIDAPDDDRRSFDYEVTLRFSDDRTYTSRTKGVVLTRLHPKHAGVWRGDAFPKVRRPARQVFTGPRVDHTNGREKRISLDYLRRRLDQFINDRQDTGPAPSTSPRAALRRIRLHNTGNVWGSTLPNTYVDVQALEPATFGVRVPSFAISPWVAAGSVFGNDGQNGLPEVHFDHTSLLATIVRRFLPDNPPAMGARYAAAEDVSRALAPTRRAVTGPLRPFLPYRITSADGGGTLGPHTTIAPGSAVAIGPDPGPGARTRRTRKPSVLRTAPTERSESAPESAGSTSPPSRTAASSSTPTSPPAPPRATGRYGHCDRCPRQRTRRTRSAVPPFPGWSCDRARTQRMRRRSSWEQPRVRSTSLPGGSRARCCPRPARESRPEAPAGGRSRVGSPDSPPTLAHTSIVAAARFIVKKCRPGAPPSRTRHATR